MRERMIITGGAGFIGCNFAKMMISRYPERELIVLDKLTYAGNLKNLEQIGLNPMFTFRRGDICDCELVKSLIRKDDTIVHFAAESHVDNSFQDSDPFYRSNVEGTRTLLEQSLLSGVKLFIQISTDEIYGSLNENDLKSKESDYGKGQNSKATSPYSISKAQAEQICFSFMPKMPLIITRSSNNFGEFQHPEKMIPRAVTHLIQGKKIPVYGKGTNIRDWIYVQDNCEGIDTVIRKGIPGEIYNIGGGNQTRNIDLANTLIKIFNLPDTMLEFVGDRKNHDLRYDIDSSKLKSLGWSPKHQDLEFSLRETVDWYKQNPDWWKPLKEEAELKYSRKK